MLISGVQEGRLSSVTCSSTVNETGSCGRPSQSWERSLRGRWPEGPLGSIERDVRSLARFVEVNLLKGRRLRFDQDVVTDQCLRIRRAEAELVFSLRIRVAG